MRPPVRIHASAKANVRKIETTTPAGREVRRSEAKLIEAEVAISRINRSIVRPCEKSGRQCRIRGGIHEPARTPSSWHKPQLKRAQGDYSLWNAGAWQPDLEIAQASPSIRPMSQMKQTEI